MQISGSSALQGIYQAQQMTYGQVSKIASKDMMEGRQDAVDPMVQMKSATYQYQASAKVLATENNMAGTLIDTFV